MIESSRCFGVVTMSSIEEAETAKQQIDGNGRDYNCEVVEKSIGETLGNFLEGDWQRRKKRLSNEIACKFFDLQDMLGFDKASNTLEWLLTKSKRTIKELAGSKQQSSSGNNNGGGVANNIKNFSFSSFHEGEDDEVDSVINQQLLITDIDDMRRREQKEEELRAKMKESKEKARARASGYYEYDFRGPTQRIWSSPARNMQRQGRNRNPREGYGLFLEKVTKPRVDEVNIGANLNRKRS
ncbi:hypothetical protein PIB30_014341 [Stylosanthes scabra]|nr:hypothetical protein [Stylosanthes scabra]